MGHDDTEDGQAILLRRRMLLQSSLALAAASAATACEAPRPCLSIAHVDPVCPTEPATTPLGRWLLVGGQVPRLVPSEPILFAGDMFEAVEPGASGPEATGAARVRAKWVTGPANGALTEAATGMLDDLMKALEGRTWASLEVRIEPLAPPAPEGGTTGAGAAPPSETPPPPPPPAPEEGPDGAKRAAALSRELSTRGRYVEATGSGTATQDGSFHQIVTVRVC